MRVLGAVTTFLLGAAATGALGCSKDGGASTSAPAVATLTTALPTEAPPTPAPAKAPEPKNASPPVAEPPPGEAPVLEVQEVEDTGSMPKGAKLSRDGKHFYVTNFGQYDKRSVTIYDSKTLAPEGEIDLPGVTVESALSPDGKTLYVSNFHKSSVEFVDLETRKIVREVTTGKNPKILVASPDGKSVFTSNWTSNDVTQVDVASAAVVRTLKAGKQPRGMAMSKSGKLFVANFFGESIDIFEGEDLSKHHRITVCKCPRHLVVSPDDQTLYITCLTASQIHAMDIATEKVMHTAQVGDAPKSVDVSPAGRYLYTADYGATRSVSVVDTKTWLSRVFPIPAMDRASGVAVAPDGTHALVTGWYDNHVYLVGFQGSGGHPEDAKAKMRKWQLVPRHPDPGD